MENLNNEKTNQNETPEIISNAIATAERIEKANKESAELIKKLEKLEAYRALGGKSEGRPQEEKPKQIDPKDYAKSILNGRV